MQKTTLNLAALISAALLAACGSSADETVANALVPAPTAPNAAEVAAFNASKQRREAMDYSGNDEFRPYSISANGHTLLRVSGSRSNPVAEFDVRSLPAGFAAYNGTYTENAGSAPVKVRSYQGFRSGVVTIYDNKNNSYMNAVPYGVPTPPAALPAAGKATYHGTAFDSNERGSLTYHVDFAAKTGQGRIEGLRKYGSIILAAGKITQETQLDGSNEALIRGKASAATGSNLDYGLTFYGNRAEEIAGYAVNGYEGIGLHGTRGAITE